MGPVALLGLMVGWSHELFSILTQGFLGYRAGQVRLIFCIPQRAHGKLFPGMMPPGHLAYIEWFTAFTAPDRHTGLYKISRCRNTQQERLASVIEVRNIRHSCHLYPACTGQYPREWTSSTVLDQCDTFFVSPFSDQHMYMTFV